MVDEPIFKTDEASKGGFQAIKEIEGDLVSITKIPNPWQEDGRDVVEVKLENALIREMDSNEPEPELRDDEFTYRLNYAMPGRKAHKNSFYVKGFLASAEKLSITLQAKYDAPIRVVLRKEAIDLGFKNQEGKQVIVENLVFAEGGAFKPEDIKDHVVKLILGKTKATAMRAILTDSKAKRYPEYREALNAGTLAEMLGLAVVDGKFAEELAK